jgi:hypothetical protein
VEGEDASQSWTSLTLSASTLWLPAMELMYLTDDGALCTCIPLFCDQDYCSNHYIGLQLRTTRINKNKSPVFTLLKSIVQGLDG